MVNEIEPIGVYDRSLARDVYQWFGFIVLALLNIALVGSDIVRLQSNSSFSWQHELVTYAFLLFMDLTVFIPGLFQVRCIRVWEDRLAVQTMFWTSQLAWQDIISLTLPAYMRVGIMKTKRCYYLIDRRAIRGFDEFLTKLKEKLA